MREGGPGGSSRGDRPIRILVVGGRWPPETFIARRLEGLARAGFSVTVAANRGKGGTDAKLDGVRWKPLPVLEDAPVRSAAELLFHGIKGVLLAPRRTARVWQLASDRPGRERIHRFFEFLPLVTENPDWLHFEWNFAATHYLPLFDLWHCRSVVSCRGTQVLIAPCNPSRMADVGLMPKTFEKASEIHCVSKAVAKTVRELGAPESKISVIRPAVDTQAFCPKTAVTSSTVGPFRIIMACSLNWVKGYEYALVALRMLRDSGVDARLTIAGSGDKANRQRLLYTLHDLNLVEAVHLAGALPPAEIIEKLRASDVYLSSSVSEGISNSVLEAMSCGLPVVSTDCPGMEEVITDGVNGFLVPVRQPGDLALRLEELARNSDLRSAIGTAARSTVLAGFNQQRLMAEWVELYRNPRPDIGRED